MYHAEARRSQSGIAIAHAVAPAEAGVYRAWQNSTVRGR
jgi:hypothetical protein